MTVTTSNSITNSIKYYRENVYYTDNFKDKFEHELAKKVYAIDTEFVPDQFGGWVVSVTTNRNKGIEAGITYQSSDCYVNKVSQALIDAISNVDKYIPDQIIAMNLANVIITGPNSIAVKI